ncbi:MAG: YncE family protein [Planctomycetota bacterium]|jgi:YVTN family beta-propeller protein
MIKYCMSKAMVWMCMFLLLAGLACVTLVTETGAEYLSPSALVADEHGKTLYVAEATAKQVAVVNTDTAKIKGIIRVPAEPTGLALSADGAQLYVTCAGPEGRLCVIETAANKIIKQIPVGHGARSPVLGPDGGVLYVCNRFSNDVSVISTRKNKHVAKINVLREPFAADITPDGKWLFVGNHLPDGPADAESVACKVSVIRQIRLCLSHTRPLYSAHQSVGTGVDKYQCTEHYRCRE